MNRPPRKLDLLAECNDQHLPPRQFEETFCRRCRNPQCVNAQWADSAWEKRISTQVERLLINPERGDPTEERWREIVSQPFLEPPPGYVPDVWGPGAARVHLSPPAVDWASAASVDEARARLKSERNGGSTPTEPIPVEGPAPPPEEASPPPPRAPSTEAVGPRPRHFNTPFPEGGVMVEPGGEVSTAPPSPATPGQGVDVWTPRPRPSNVVSRGARIKMGG